MHVPTMKMFDMGWYNHPMLHVALPGTLMLFYHGELLFSHTPCAVDLILKWKSVTWQSRWHVKYMCTPTYIHVYHIHTHTNKHASMHARMHIRAHTHTHTHTHNLMITFTNTYHVHSNVYILGTFLHVFL